MLGKASEIKTKAVYPKMTNNPEWDASHPTKSSRYFVSGIDEVLNETLQSLGEAQIISIQYKMSSQPDDCAESALIIYKEAKPPCCNDPFCVGDCKEGESA